MTPLDPGADEDGQRVVVAIIGIGVLYGLLILFGQFVAQGSSRRRPAVWWSCCSPR
ncbi:hypothetical protein [Blastococcus brunescens]|uniref:Uncharacterized protein n=1 Tax=Blastococcus brunescens TaxID=1564165 RepID=A0ABZ1B2P9_9ACTN|nr:hypothetical protein [Blastococcus sp. BMG 8361]WRL64652.1 hypothetical protein U6N30_02345 [Blastococcus sp. BMG 8361]